MACDEIEILILDYQEGHLPESERQRVEAHLRGCADCRVFADELQRLDGALTRTIQPLRMPAEFNERVRERIQAAPIPLSEAAIAERKRRLQAEYEAGLARLPLRSFSLAGFLNSAGYLLAVAVAAWIAWWFAPRWIEFLNACSGSLQDPNTILLLVVGAACVLIGFAVSFQSPVRRLWT